ERSIAETEAIDLFLHGTAAGLFDMDWLLLCPMCSDVVDSFRSLTDLHSHYHCHLCQSDYEAALDDYIAVTFTVPPTVRRIRFHDPQTLSVEDYAQTFRDLFRSEVIKATEGIAIRDVTPPVHRSERLDRALPAYRRPQR